MISRKKQNKTSRTKPNKSSRKKRNKTSKANQPRFSTRTDDALWSLWPDEQAARLAIHAGLARLENDRSTTIERHARELEKLALRTRSKDLPELAHARRRLHAATLALVAVQRLRRDIQAIMRDAETRLAVIEVEMLASTAAAIARFHAGNVARQAHVARLPSTVARDLASELAEAKQATAIVIADRNHMRDELARLAVDPERAEEAAELRRELVLQEAAVDNLKHGLQVLAAAAQ